jgi:hypothetical protein
LQIAPELALQRNFTQDILPHFLPFSFLHFLELSIFYFFYNFFPFIYIRYFFAFLSLSLSSGTVAVLVTRTIKQLMLKQLTDD